MSRRAFTILMVGYGTQVVLLTAPVYRAGFVAAFELAFWVSWLPMQFIGLCLQGYTMLNPKKQFWGFLFGDSIMLPTVAGFLAVFWQHSHYRWWSSWWWIAISVVIGLVVAEIFHRMEKANYHLNQLESPTKRWHDEMVMFSFSVLLLRGLPALFWSDWGLFSHHWYLGVITLVVFFAWLILAMVIDPKRPNLEEIKLSAHPLYLKWAVQ